MGTTGGPTMSCLLEVTLITLMILCGLSIAVQVTPEGSIENLTIALDPKLPVDDADELIQKLQSHFSKASEVLCNATDGRFSFGSLNVMLPYTWTNLSNILLNHTKIYPKSSLQRSRPEIRVESGITNDVIQSRGCGKQGDVIKISSESILEGTDDTTHFDKILVNLWIRWRYGVFSENAPGLHYNPKEEEFIPNACTNTKLNFTAVSETDQHCSYNNIASCNITINENNERIISSLLFSTKLPMMSKFCNASTHNSFATILQNSLCNGLSVGEIMAQHPDYNITSGTQNNKSKNCVQKSPNVVVVPFQSRKFYLWLAVNLSDEVIDSISTSLLMIVSKLTSKLDTFVIYYQDTRIGEFNVTEETNMGLIDSELKKIMKSQKPYSWADFNLWPIIKEIENTNDDFQATLILMTDIEKIPELTNISASTSEMSITVIPSTITDPSDGTTTSSNSSTQSSQGSTTADNTHSVNPINHTSTPVYLPANTESNKYSTTIKEPTSSLTESAMNSVTEQTLSTELTPNSTKSITWESQFRKMNLQINTIAIGENVDSYLEHIAMITRGHTYFVKNINTSVEPCLLLPLMNLLQNEKTQLTMILQQFYYPTPYDIQFLGSFNIIDNYSDAFLLVRHQSPHLWYPIMTPLQIHGIWTINHANCQNYSQDMKLDICAIQDFKKGEWMLSLEQTKPSDTSIYIVAKSTINDMHILPTAWIDQDAYRVNLTEAPLLVYAEIQQYLKNISLVEMVAVITDEKNSISKLKLQDSGLGADLMENDGIFTGALMNCSKKGRHRIEVQIQGVVKNYNCRNHDECSEPFKRYFDLGSVFIKEWKGLENYFTVRDLTVFHSDANSTKVRWKEVWTNQTGNVRSYGIYFSKFQKWSSQAVKIWNEVKQLNLTLFGTMRTEIVEPKMIFGNTESVILLALQIHTEEKTLMSNIVSLQIKHTESTTEAFYSSPTSSSLKTTSDYATSSSSTSTETTTENNIDVSVMESSSKSKAITAGVVSVTVILIIGAAAGFAYYIVVYRRRRLNTPSYSVGYSNLT